MKPLLQRDSLTGNMGSVYHSALNHQLFGYQCPSEQSNRLYLPPISVLAMPFIQLFIHPCLALVYGTIFFARPLGMGGG